MNIMEQARLAALELEKRRGKIGPICDTSFPEQASFVMDKSRFVAAQTTRRSGKSTGLGYKFFNVTSKYANVMCPYITLTRDSAFNIVWPILKEIDEKYKLGSSFTESNLTVTRKNGSTIKLFGADQKNFIERLRGIKTPLAAIDESQSMRQHIEALVDDILTPAISDYPDGQLVVTGTPGPVPKGYFFDISHGKFGFITHKWTVYNNPYMPNIKAMVDDLKEKKGWNDQSPTYRREWLGDWVSDPDALVYKFSRDLNVADFTLPEGCHYVLGVDLGYDPDPSAFVLCAFHQHDRRLFIIDVYKQHKMIVSDVAERIKYYMLKYPTIRVVADLGAQGKMIGEEISQRYGIPIQAADKHGKAGFIEIMNSDLQRGLIKISREIAPEIEAEMMNLIWDTEKAQRVEDSRYENHICDAILYAWRFCYNFAHTEKPKVVLRGTTEAMDQYWKDEEERILQSIKEQKEMESYL